MVAAERAQLEDLTALPEICNADLGRALWTSARPGGSCRLSVTSKLV